MHSIQFHTLRIVTLGLLLAGGQAQAADIVVKVSGANSDQGQIGCSLFENSPAFPMDASNAKQVWQAAEAASVVCKFTAVTPGTYAVAVSHDLNGNRRVDTNFLGIPKEGWGVSNNVVPTLRAPRFDEAQFQVKYGVNAEINIKLVY